MSCLPTRGTDGGGRPDACQRARARSDPRMQRHLHNSDNGPATTSAAYSGPAGESR